MSQSVTGAAGRVMSVFVVFNHYELYQLGNCAKQTVVQKPLKCSHPKSANIAL